MTAKQAFLNNLQQQIKALQAAYDANKDLPDSVFDGVPVVPVLQPQDSQRPTIIYGKQVDKPTANVQQLPSNGGKGKGQQPEYGINKRTLIKILQDKGKAMIKWDIQEKFAEMLGRSTDEVLNTVTNTLSTLKEDGTIIGYKPKGLVFKGQFWGLAEWFVNGEIKEDYSPFKNVTIL